MAAKPEFTWQEVARQLNNPRENHKLHNVMDSEDINQIRIRGVFEKRKERLLKRMNKRTSLQDVSESKVDATRIPAWRSNPSIPTSDADQIANRKDTAQLKDKVVSHQRKSVERKKSKMAFDEKHDTGSLLPSLDDGGRSAKSPTDVDTTPNSSRQNNEKLPPIDKNQLVAGNKKSQEEKSRINSSDSTNMENRNAPDHRKRNANSNNKMSSLGTSSKSDKDEDEEEKSHINSTDSTNMDSRNAPDHRRRNENSSNSDKDEEEEEEKPRINSNDSTSTENRKSPDHDKDEEEEEEKPRINSNDSPSTENRKSPDQRKGNENSSNCNNDEEEEQKSRINSNDSTNAENRNSPVQRKGNENSPSKTSPLGTSNSDEDGDKRTNPEEDPQNSEIKRLDGKGTKIKEAPHVEKSKEDNDTGQEKESNRPEEQETGNREFPNEKPKKRILGKDAVPKSTFGDEGLDQLIPKLERFVNRNLRALQGMKPDDADEEDEELDQQTINRFLNRDRQKEIDKFLKS